MITNIEKSWLCTINCGSYWDEGTLCYEKIEIYRIKQGDKYGLCYDTYYSYNYKEILPPIYSKIDFVCVNDQNNKKYEEAFFIINEKGKFGVVSFSYNILQTRIPIIYDNIIRIFNFFKTELDGLYGIYTKDGRKSTPCLFENIEIDIEKRIIITYKNNHQGIFSFDCSEIYPPILDRIEYKSILDKNDRYKQNSKNEYIIVEQNGRKGIFDYSNYILPLYDKIEKLKGHYCYFKVCIKNKWGIFCGKNKEICPVNYDKIELMGSEFNKTDYFKVCLNNSWGLYNENKEICPTICDDIYYENGNVKIRQRNSFGIVPLSGNTCIKPIYDDIKNITLGYIAIKQEEKWGIIDDNENIIINPKYQDIQEMIAQNDPSYKVDCPLFKVLLNNNWGCVDKNDTLVIPAIYDNIIYYDKRIYARKENIKYEYSNLEDENPKSNIFWIDQSLGYESFNSLFFLQDISNDNLLD